MTEAYSWTREGVHSIPDSTQFRVPNLVDVIVTAKELKHIRSTDDGQGSWLSDMALDTSCALLQVMECNWKVLSTKGMHTSSLHILGLIFERAQMCDKNQATQHA